MSEESDTTIAELRAELRSIRKATDDELLSIRNELKEALTATSSKDTADRAELREMLGHVNEWIKRREEAEVKGDEKKKSTIVSPPIDFAKTVDEPPQSETGGTETRRRSWKDLW